jgi:Na+-driven multidrug efflux pump
VKQGYQDRFASRSRGSEGVLRVRRPHRSMAAALIRLTMPTGDLVRRIFRGGAWSLFGKLSGAILFVALNALLAHLLPTKDVGAFFICFSIVSAASLLIPLGANQAIVRYMAAARAKGQSALL